jgi:hypothetical protein
VSRKYGTGHALDRLSTASYQVPTAASYPGGVGHAIGGSITSRIERALRVAGDQDLRQMQPRLSAPAEVAVQNRWAMASC